MLEEGGAQRFNDALNYFDQYQGDVEQNNLEQIPPAILGSAIDILSQLELSACSDAQKQLLNEKIKKVLAPSSVEKPQSVVSKLLLFQSQLITNEQLDFLENLFADIKNEEEVGEDQINEAKSLMDLLIRNPKDNKNLLQLFKTLPECFEDLVDPLADKLFPSAHVDDMKRCMGDMLNSYNFNKTTLHCLIARLARTQEGRKYLLTDKKAKLATKNLRVFSLLPFNEMLENTQEVAFLFENIESIDPKKGPLLIGKLFQEPLKHIDTLFTLAKEGRLNKKEQEDFLDAISHTKKGKEKILFEMELPWIFDWLKNKAAIFFDSCAQEIEVHHSLILSRETFKKLGLADNIFSEFMNKLIGEATSRDKLIRWIHTHNFILDRIESDEQIALCEKCLLSDDWKRYTFTNLSQMISRLSKPIQDHLLNLCENDPRGHGFFLRLIVNQRRLVSEKRAETFISKLTQGSEIDKQLLFHNLERVLRLPFLISMHESIFESLSQSPLGCAALLENLTHFDRNTLISLFEKGFVESAFENVFLKSILNPRSCFLGLLELSQMTPSSRKWQDFFVTQAGEYANLLLAKDSTILLLQEILDKDQMRMSLQLFDELVARLSSTVEGSVLLISMKDRKFFNEQIPLDTQVTILCQAMRSTNGLLKIANLHDKIPSLAFKKALTFPALEDAITHSPEIVMHKQASFLLKNFNEKEKVALRNVLRSKTPLASFDAPFWEGIEDEESKASSLRSSPSYSFHSVSSEILFSSPEEQEALFLVLHTEGKDFFVKFCMQLSPSLVLDDAQKHILVDCIERYERPDIALLLCENKLLTQNDFENRSLYHWLGSFNSLNEDKTIKQKVLHLAEDCGLGYKTANLMIMDLELQKAHDAIVRELGESKACQLAIPAFLGLSDKEIQSFLKHSYPELKEDWKAFLSTFQPPFQEVNFRALDEIQKKILQAFSDPDITFPRIVKWLKQVAPKYVIIRSTGNEDTQDNTNPGGNDSLPFIHPNEPAIYHAIGKVLASYFNIDSLKQRFISKDPSLFNEDPFLPVLLQEMAVEDPEKYENEVPENVPRSGVLFMQNIGEDNQITNISAVLGSAEGAVSSQVAGDILNVDTAGSVYSIIREKDERIVFNTEGEMFQQETQSKDLANKEALNAKELTNLDFLGRYMARFYGQQQKPANIDMEFTLINQVIYLLQARPLKTFSEEANFSFIDLRELKQVNEEKKCKGVCLLAGDSRVLSLTHNQEILFSEDLSSAYNSYLSLNDEKRSQVKAIMIKKMPLPNSHQALFFHGLRMPISVMEQAGDYEKAQDLFLKVKPEQGFLLCPQKAVLVASSKENESVFIKQGLTTYPGPLEYSIPQKILFQGQDAAFVQMTLKTIMEKALAISKNLEGEFVFSEPASTIGLFELFDRMALGQEDEARACLSLLIKKLHSIYRKGINNKDPVMAFFLEDWLNKLETICDLSTGNLVRAFKAPPQSKERLYYLKPLEAIFLQKSSRDIQGADSISQLFEIGHNIKNINAHSRFDILRDLVIKQALNKEAKQKLQNLIDNLSDDESKQAFCLLMLQIDRLGLMFEWCNGNDLVSFTIDGRGTFDPASAKRAILFFQKEFDQSEEIIRQVSLSSKRLQSFKKHISILADPRLRKISLSRFIKNFVRQTDFESIVESLENLEGVGRSVALKYLEEFVDTYDAAIKAIAGSLNYHSIQEKAADFSQMLTGYYFIFKMLSKLAISVGKEKDELLSYIEFGETEIKGPFLDLQTRIKRFELNETECREQLCFRRNFDVRALLLDLDLSNGIILPETLEEFFTTFHQLMLYYFNEANTRLSVESLPEESQALCMELDLSRGPDKIWRPMLKEIKRIGDQIETSIEIPIRQHAAQIKIKEDLNKKFLQIEVSAFGKEEFDRWKRSASISGLLSHKYELDCPAPPRVDYKNPSGCTFYLQLSKGELANKKELVKDLRKWILRGLVAGGTTLTQDMLSVLEDISLEFDINSYCQQDLQTLSSSLALNCAIVESECERGDFVNSAKLLDAILKKVGVDNLDLSDLTHFLPSLFNTPLAENVKKWWEASEQRDIKRKWQQVVAELEPSSLL